MAKETYYFRHDFTPTADPKIEAMLANYGATGYGLYWKIVELLHADSAHKIPTKQYIMIAIAKQMHSTSDFVLQFINDCINIFELFKQENDMIFCDRVFRNIQDREEKSNTAKANAKARWDAVALQKNAVALQSDAIKVNKRKGKKSKEDEIKKEQTLQRFEKFWFDYQKPVDKKKCFEKFQLLTEGEIEVIFTTLPNYIKSTPDIQFRKNPTTYLNGKCWNDSMPVATQPKIRYEDTDEFKS